MLQSEQMLTEAHLREMFRIVPGQQLPFGPRFPYNTRCTATGAIPRDSWLQLWRHVSHTVLTTVLIGLLS